ncbi:protein-disulfide reductase DsbD domain-containing protein [Methyloligella solikamskensis]|uniref:Protein-disulfide reductase DsbD domain-containing protein n=1 Tax=Methyloligella solikamskensis TaxID=1177756 RepID=A0ABW3JG15_9HYPH
MMLKRRAKFRCLVAVLAAVLMAGVSFPSGQAQAASSKWVEAADSKLRLITGGELPDGEGSWAGIEIRMEPGWKTYWKSPGDTGVPPYFDWSGSENLKSAEILYPAPKNLPDAGGQAYGYKGEVVFPVKVTPEREGESVTLKLTMDFGLCKDICIPNHAELSIRIPAEPKPSVADSLLIDRYLAWVPKPVEQGDLPDIANIEKRFDKLEPELVIDIRYPEGAERADLFVDAGEDYIPPAMEEGDGKDGAKRFVITFRDKDEVQDLKGEVLTFTMVSDRGAREAKRTLE